MNWQLALGWDSQKAKEAKDYFKVDNIPCLIIVNPETAKIISRTGVSEVSEQGPSIIEEWKEKR